MSEVARTGKQSLFVLGVRICGIALGIVLWGCVPGFAALVPCGEASAPQCAGGCPEGQRCIATPDALFQLTITTDASCGDANPLRRESAAQNGDCECAAVPCGGVPLEQNQGCCNGRPFTLGTQGCCHGVILDATEPCDCGEEGSINLATRGCCGEGDAGISYDPALQTCCQQPVTEEGCEGNVATTSSFNIGFDCCPGKIASASEFCDGQCVGGVCESTPACCQCDECFQGPRCAAGGPTVVAGELPIACIVGCFSQACLEFEQLTQVAGGTCNEGGICVPPTPTPAVSGGGLLLAAALLAASGCLALVRLRKTRNGGAR